MRVVVYGAGWSAPCREVTDTLSRAKIKYELIDIDDEPDKAANIQLRALPTVVIMDDKEEEIERFVGSFTSLVPKIQELLVD